MDTKDILLFIGPIAGVIVGGIITTMAKGIELRHIRKTEKLDRHFKNLEDLQGIIGNFILSANLLAETLMSLTAPNFSPEERRRLLIGSIREFSHQLSGAGFKLQVWAPELESMWQEAMKRLDDLGPTCVEFVNILTHERSTPVRQSTFDQFQVDILNVAAATLLIQEQLTKKVIALHHQ